MRAMPPGAMISASRWRSSPGYPVLLLPEPTSCHSMVGGSGLGSLSLLQDKRAAMVSAKLASQRTRYVFIACCLSDFDAHTFQGGVACPIGYFDGEMIVARVDVFRNLDFRDGV